METSKQYNLDKDVDLPTGEVELTVEEKAIRWALYKQLMEIESSYCLVDFIQLEAPTGKL